MENGARFVNKNKPTLPEASGNVGKTIINRPFENGNLVTIPPIKIVKLRGGLLLFYPIGNWKRGLTDLPCFMTVGDIANVFAVQKGGIR